MLDRKRPHVKTIFTYASICLILLSGCAGDKSEAEIAAEQTLQAINIEAITAEAPTPTVEAVVGVDWVLPVEPPEPDRILADSVSSYFASEKKATQGDNFHNGLYERPFTSEDMIYRPDLDITTVDFAPGELFFYFTIRLYGMNPQGGGLKGTYGIEFDRTWTGRGDMLVWVKNPSKEWSTEEVTIYGDDNRDVGGLKPVITESGFDGSGYDIVIEMDEGKNAYARIDPKDGNAVQIAVSYPLLGEVPEFAWGAWADDGLLDPAQFDYNDRMGPSAAGSPLKGEYYPLKNLFNLDNTCRLLYGTGQSGIVPGICKVGVPKSSNGCTWHCDFPRYYSNKDYCIKYGHNWVCD